MITIDKIHAPTNGGTVWTGTAHGPEEAYVWHASAEGGDCGAFVERAEHRGFFVVLDEPPAPLAEAVRAVLGAAP
jgi:hypothetical protein